MNLVEVTELLQHPEMSKDAEMVTMYTRKQNELVAAINADCGTDLSLRELLLLSPKPHLAVTV